MSKLSYCIFRVKAVCMDMWAAYRASVERYIPHAIKVFDRFHLVKHLNEAVDEVRKQMVRQLYANERRTVKGTRYLWLKHSFNLTDKERQSLRGLLKTNLPIVRAYLLKEAFQKFWDYQSTGWCKRWLKQWFWWATHSRLKPLRDFAYLLRRHEEGIVAWTRLRISNGAVEGMNNKIKPVNGRLMDFEPLIIT
ncbi:MAG: transposase [bacterium]